MGNDSNNQSFSRKFEVFFNRYTPNSMIFAYILTVIVAVLALIFTKVGFVGLIDAWVKGFWNLLTFAMQMSLIMITGSVVATSPPVKRLLHRIALAPNSMIAYFTTLMLIGWVLTWIHWGVGMMVSINLGREMLTAAKDKGIKVHAPSFISTSYCLGIAAVGISQAAPLLGATKGYLQSLCVNPEAAAYVGPIIPMSKSVLSPLVLIECVVLFLVIYAVGYIVQPKKANLIVEVNPALYQEMKTQQAVAEQKGKVKATTPAERINTSPVLPWIIGACGLFWCVKLLATEGFIGISINNFNFILLMLSVVLCGDTETFIKGCINAVSSIWGVIIQFPFYAGIFGMIAYTGFSEVIVNAFMSIATQRTFPLVTYIYSSILNMAVPSGGSKFAIEAPYLLDVCARLKVDVGKILCVYTFGDQTTNIIQPFWALPYLGLYKIEFKEMLPYTFPICIASLIVCAIFTFA